MYLLSKIHPEDTRSFFGSKIHAKIHAKIHVVTVEDVKIHAKIHVVTVEEVSHRGEKIHLKIHKRYSFEDTNFSQIRDLISESLPREHPQPFERTQATEG